ncbi:MAG: 3-dehydroquinate synthase [Lachnospiraceae bacterium]|nr:3-dehydroquinate synthase [Lachnospiraceae bacterium]
MSRLLSVSYEQKPCYDIHLEEDFEGLIPALVKAGYHKDKKVCIVTDSNVAPLYGEALQKELESQYADASMYVFPAGEEHKNTDTVGGAYEHFIRHSMDRKDFVVALGGGVVGDLAGFAAATYLRGIDFIQIPTTLLSQVDSSIGGKTGVDFLQYKNMVGAFYMPKLVYMNLSVLRSLPEEQFCSGMGEILKHGQIMDERYFSQVAQSSRSVQQRNLEVLQEMIYGSCKIKRDVVQRDPKEQGERALLNFGHTIGHAVEKLSHFQLLHGQCVALGMVSAAYISHRFGTYEKESLKQLEETIAFFGLPVRLTHPDFTPQEVLAATKLDKKMESGKIKFILLEHPGKAYISKELTDLQILEGIQYLFT